MAYIPCLLRMWSTRGCLLMWTFLVAFLSDPTSKDASCHFQSSACQSHRSLGFICGLSHKFARHLQLPGTRICILEMPAWTLSFFSNHLLANSIPETLAGVRLHTLSPTQPYLPTQCWNFPCFNDSDSAPHRGIP